MVGRKVELPPPGWAYPSFQVFYGTIDTRDDPSLLFLSSPAIREAGGAPQELRMNTPREKRLVVLREGRFRAPERKKWS